MVRDCGIDTESSRKIRHGLIWRTVPAASIRGETKTARLVHREPAGPCHVAIYRGRTYRLRIAQSPPRRSEKFKLRGHFGEVAKDAAKRAAVAMQQPFTCSRAHANREAEPASRLRESVLVDKIQAVFHFGAAERIRTRVALGRWVMIVERVGGDCELPMPSRSETEI